MAILKIDFNGKTGKVKPMHGVNNGPFVTSLSTQNVGNFNDYVAAGFPFARTHDSSFCIKYGFNHTIDVENIFTNFDKDPYDENNYDFVCTDDYIAKIIKSGAQVFYRLGTSIEHLVKKYHANPPKDFKKYAIVCEHIIRHYNCEWANGFNYGIKFWEIWNEPDTHVDGLAHPDDPSWTGTPEQFFEFFNVMQGHLKSCFPDLLIGGPAAGGPWRKWVDDFLASVKAEKLDFFSYHSYTNNPRDYVKYANIVKEKLHKRGFDDSITVLGEWNYAQGWSGDGFTQTVKAVKGLKGASFSQASMSACQYAPVDILLYYDARPCKFNGMFSTDFPSEKLKGYYPFYNFNKLYQIGESIAVKCNDEDVYSCAAFNGEQGGILLTYFNNETKTAVKRVNLETMFTEDGEYNVKYYLLSKTKNNELVREETVSGKTYNAVVNIPLYNCYYIEIKKIK